MIHIGKIDLAFAAQAQGIDVGFDPNTHQQVMTFKFGVTVSLPQMLQQLQKFQYRDAMPLASQDNMGLAGAPGLSAGAPPGSLTAPSSIPGSITAPSSVPARQNYPQQANVEGVQPVVIPPTSNHSTHGTQAQKMRDPPSLKGAGPQGGQRPQVPAPPPTAQQLQLQAPRSADGAFLGAGAGEGAAAAPASLPLNAALVDALRDNNVTKAQLAIGQRADVNCVEAGPHLRTPLHHALEAGGNVELVNMLLQARANVNTPCARGKTPLHLAIQQYMSIPPVVIRMLICWKADLMKADSRGATPIQTAKLVAMQLHTQQGGQIPAAENTRMRQLLNEVSDQPTTEVVVVDAKEVKRVLFADAENDKLVFHTDSAVGLYSLKNRRLIFIKRLRQLQVASSVQHVSVNPQLGTIAVCLTIADNTQPESMQNVIIVWPNGHIQDEEPLKTTMKIGFSEGAQSGDLLPPCVLLSRGQGPQMLLSRLIDGQVFCWRLNSARSQLMSEVNLLSRGGLMAVSDDGCWIAAVNQDKTKDQLQVWAYENLNRQEPQHLVSLNMRLDSLAIIQQPVTEGGQSSCLLAAAQTAEPGMPQPAIEILSVAFDGSTSLAYRIQSHSLCHTLDFCGLGSDLHLLSGQVDGLAIVVKPSTGEISMSHDSTGIGHIAISRDHSLIASVESNYMRVYKVPMLEAR